MHTAKAAQVSLVSTAQKSKSVAARVATHDPKQLRAQARADYGRALAQTKKALQPAAPAPSSGKGFFKLIGTTSLPRDRVSKTTEVESTSKVQISGGGKQVKVLDELRFYDPISKQWGAVRWQSMESSVPEVIIPGQPARFRLTGGASADSGMAGCVSLGLGSSRARSAGARARDRSNAPCRARMEHPERPVGPAGGEGSRRIGPNRRDRVHAHSVRPFRARPIRGGHSREPVADRKFSPGAGGHPPADRAQVIRLTDNGHQTPILTSRRERLHCSQTKPNRIQLAVCGTTSTRLSYAR